MSKWDGKPYKFTTAEDDKILKRIASLRKRDSEAFQLFVNGLTIQEISDAMHLSPIRIHGYLRTARIHIDVTLSKSAELAVLVIPAMIILLWYSVFLLNYSSEMIAKRFPGFIEEEETPDPAGLMIDTGPKPPCGPPCDHFWEPFRLLARAAPEEAESLRKELGKHPFSELRALVGAREVEVGTIPAERGEYELVWIPGGEFLMGSETSEEGRHSDEGPVHKVTLDGFHLGRYPVTNEEYGRFLKESPGGKEPE